jgi:ssDNA-binding Zn-finger/Zn-ribbon topoisomerase 1
MGNDPRKDNTRAQNVKKQFDETLGSSIEYLIGTRYGVGALPLNLATISSIILLSERENEIDSFPGTLSERYTYETLLNELAEIGLDSEEDLKMNLQDMIQKGYIYVDRNGKFSAQKPTISMAKLFDRVFPNMPGMNFIAYFTQTMDEAQSGRKDLDSAISQFDQMLKMQGVSLLKQKTNLKPGKAPEHPVKRRTKLKKTKTPNISASGPKIISSDGNLGQVEIRELFTRQDEPQENPEEIDKTIKAQETEIFEEAEEKVPEPDPDKQDSSEGTVSVETSFENTPLPHETSLYVSEPEEKETVLSVKPKIEFSETESVEIGEVLQNMEISYETKAVLEEDSFKKADDIIEKQIAALEENLAMQCPICKKYKIQTEETRTGKIYYKCSNKDCNFISWGKPYHIVCPQCQNPFLVKTLNRDGKPILKCPRATCRHWQKLSEEITQERQEKAVLQAQDAETLTSISRKPRRRVVRRRIVRRKR